MICYGTSCVAMLYNMDAARLGVTGTSLQHLGSTHRDADLLQQFEDTATSQKQRNVRKTIDQGFKRTVYVRYNDYCCVHVTVHIQAKALEQACATSPTLQPATARRGLWLATSPQGRHHAAGSRNALCKDAHALPTGCTAPSGRCHRLRPRWGPRSAAASCRRPARCTAAQPPAGAVPVVRKEDARG